MVGSNARWALMHELRDESEPTLPALLTRLSPVDLVLVEGFKRDLHPKIEVFRAANAKPPLHPDDPSIVAIASDVVLPGLKIPLHHLDDVEGIADIVEECALAMDRIRWRDPNADERT